jgi:hypothetical protein
VYVWLSVYTKAVYSNTSIAHNTIDQLLVITPRVTAKAQPRRHICVQQNEEPKLRHIGMGLSDSGWADIDIQDIDCVWWPQ